MSGHGNFSAIGPGSQRPFDTQIDASQDISRSMPVGGVMASGTAGIEEGVGEPVLSRPNDGVEKAKTLVTQLDILLARAAESATKGVDAGVVKAALNEVDLSKSDRKTLSALADKAEAAFKAVNEFTGRQLASAVAARDGKFDWAKNPAGKAIRKALDAQAELSDKLRQLVNQIPGGATSDTLEEAMMQCDRRTCEIQTLVCQFADILEKGEPDDPEVGKRLNETLSKLLPRQALQMHGNDSALAAMKETVAPLAQRLDVLAKTQGMSLSGEELAALGREIDQMSNALDGAVKSGVAGKSGIGVDRTLFAAAKDILAEVRGKLSTARRDISKASMLNFAEKTFAPVPVKMLDVKFLPLLRHLAPNVANLVAKRNVLREAAIIYANDPSSANLNKLQVLAEDYSRLIKEPEDAEKIRKELVALAKMTTNKENKLDTDKHVASRLSAWFKNAHGISTEERKACLELAKDFVDPLMEFSKGAIRDFRSNSDIGKVVGMAEQSGGILSQTAHLELMHTTAANMDDTAFLTSDTVRAAFEGELRFTTLVEARMHGLKDNDVDPNLDDVNVVSSKKLGSGAVNTVYAVGYKDGSTFIFKPEAAGRQAFENMALANGTKETQMVAQLNIASQKTADSLGLGDVMAKTTVGSHKGEFGIFMEKVKGEEAEEFMKPGRFAPEGGLSAKQVKQLPDDQYAKVVGSLMRKANRLDWFDMITGQGDRHCHNLMVFVGQDLSVSLKGIDNDASFPAYRTGIRTFELDESRADILGMAIEYAAKLLYPGDFELSKRAALRRELMNDPGVTFSKDGATVDLTKCKSPILQFCLFHTYRMHTATLPDYIDKDLYDHLMALAEPGEKRDKYIADMTAHLPENAKDAAIARLDGAIAHAKALNEKGHVVSEEQWLEKDKQREIAGKVPPDGDNGGYEDFGPVGSSSDAGLKGKRNIGVVIDHLKNGYFRRDLMRAVAKPGWFEE